LMRPINSMIEFKQIIGRLYSIKQFLMWCTNEHVLFWCNFISNTDPFTPLSFMCNKRFFLSVRSGLFKISK
jgi:hypothetical protein